MIIRELQEYLQNLIPERKISQTEIANVLNMTRSNISLRIKNNSEVTVSELQKIEQHYGVSLYPNNQSIILQPSYNLGLQYDFENWGKRLLKLQIGANILDDKKFAQILGISMKRLDDLIRKNKFPTGEEILAIKTNFSKTSLDWLLFGIGESSSNDYEDEI